MRAESKEFYNNYGVVSFIMNATSVVNDTPYLSEKGLLFYINLNAE
jgi:hypothetical protein